KAKLDFVKCIIPPDIYIYIYIYISIVNLYQCGATIHTPNGEACRVPRASVNFQLGCPRFKMEATVDVTDAWAPGATRNTRQGGWGLPTRRRRGSPFASISARTGRSAPARSGCWKRSATPDRSPTLVSCSACHIAGRGSW